MKLQTAAAQSLYRWVDDTGQVFYSDSPPADRQRDSIEQSMPQLPQTGVRLTGEGDDAGDKTEHIAPPSAARNVELRQSRR